MQKSSLSLQTPQPGWNRSADGEDPWSLLSVLTKTGPALLTDVTVWGFSLQESAVASEIHLTTPWFSFYSYNANKLPCL